jgi:phospholipid/cholesterol/gamma-HCH transport system ATP-binding protein
VLNDISFQVATGRMKILLGASGAGKSVVLKLILGLLKPDAGRIFVHGQRIDNMPEQDLIRIRPDIGMLFQESALFDSLTVAENVGYRLYEETDLPLAQVRRRVEEVLGFIGLTDYIDQMPSELSGGQRVWRSRARWRRSRTFCCSTIPRPAWIPSPPPPWTTRSSSCAISSK